MADAPNGTFRWTTGVVIALLGLIAGAITDRVNVGSQMEQNRSTISALQSETKSLEGVVRNLEHQQLDQDKLIAALIERQRIVLKHVGLTDLLP